LVERGGVGEGDGGVGMVVRWPGEAADGEERARRSGEQLRSRERGREQTGGDVLFLVSRPGRREE